MEGQPRNIVVNGQYIAHMEVDTQIVGVGYVYHFNQPSSLKPEAAEAAQPCAEESAAVAPNQRPDGYPFVVPDKLTELDLYSMEEFEALFREAARGEAKKLAAFLKKYRDLQVLDFKGQNKKQIFGVLKDFFGDEIGYGYPNFAAYF